MNFSKQALWPWGLLLLCLALYLPSVTAPFFYDDYYHFVDHAKLHSPRELGDIFFSGRQETRPVYNLSLFLQSLAFGKSSSAAHAVNVGLFMICVLGFFRFLSSLPLPKSAVVVSTLLFAAHPINVETVAYFNSRSGLLALLFALWAQPFLLKPKRGAFVLGLLLLSLAIGSKEDGVVGVLLALWTCVFLCWREKRAIPKMRFALTSLVVLWLPLLFIVFRSPHVDTIGLNVAPWSTYVLEQGRNILLHLSAFFLPYPLTLDRDLPLWMNSWEVLLGGWMILAFFLHMAWRFRTSWITFGFVWALLALAPTHSFIPVLDVHASRILFPMVPAVALATESALHKYWRRMSKVYGIIVLLALVAFSGLTAQNVRMWRDPIQVWEKNAKHAPSRWRSWVNLAVECGESGRWKQAHQAILQARRIAPNRPEVLYNQAVIYAIRKDTERSRERAIYYLQRTLEIHPRHQKAKALLKRLLSSS